MGAFGGARWSTVGIRFQLERLMPPMHRALAGRIEPSRS